jgi:hypothetical protein
VQPQTLANAASIRNPPPRELTPRELFAEWRSHARRGDFAAAWQVSDRALELQRTGVLNGFPRHFRGVWDGSPVENKRVLVHCNHGLGDTIQFARFIPRLLDVANEVTIQVQPQLQKLLAHVCDEAHLYSGDIQHGGSYDVELEIMELAHVFRIGLDDAPIKVPYIDVAPAPMPDTGKLKVGVVWQAGDWDDRRSIPFHALLEWTAAPNVELYSLQHDPVLAGWQPSPINILDATTVERTAALMRSLDLVITVDTMTAHLAGALARPVLTLLQQDADWRWLADRSDSPWYPTMRLFRQPTQGEWHPVIHDVAEQLKKAADHPRPSSS